MLTAVTDIFNFLAQTPLAGLAALGYFLLTFGDSEQRKLYFDRVFALLTDPTTLQTDTNYYNKEWFESVESGFKSFLLNSNMKAITDSLGQSLIASKNDWKKLTGWFLLGVFLIVFLIADTITVLNIASALNINLTVEFPEMFYDYGLAITIGTFFTLVTSGFVLFELYTNLGFTDFAESAYDGVKKFLKVGAWIVFISSLLVVTFLALSAWSIKSNFTPFWRDFYEVLAQFGVNVMVRINAFFATALIFTEAIKSLKTVAAILSLPAFLLMGFLYLLSSFFSIIIRFILDLLYRFVLWIMWTFSFLISAPTDKIISAPSNIMNFFKNLRK